MKNEGITKKKKGSKGGRKDKEGSKEEGRKEVRNKDEE